MTEKKAQFIFILLNIVAVVLVAMVIDDFSSITTAIATKSKNIPFDRGTYYFTLSSIFWIMSLIQFYGERDKQSFWYRKASHILIVWFLFSLALSYLLPAYLKARLVEAGYTQCLAPDSIQRAAKTDSLVFIIGQCEHQSATE